ncbi:hypothetical protein [Clostridium perfringens]|uniref:hypothetical protein n=1 Tax=Clostridium perfringens TaxID=1502 RepID=UPI0039E8D961
MAMSLEETIARLRFIASVREAKKQYIEAKESLQLMNWLIELKKIKEEEKNKIELLDRMLKEKEEYIKSLESLMIFMCKTYDEIENSLVNLVKEKNNEAFFVVPRIQGINHIINISKIGKLNFEEPVYGFKDILEVMKNKYQVN